MSTSRKPIEGDAIDVLLDYWDGPIRGIVLVGEPYYFEALFDAGSDSYSGVYKITAIGEGTRQLAVEVERRWQRMPEGQRRAKTEPSDYVRELNKLKESIVRDQQENPSWQATANFVRNEGEQNDRRQAFRVVWNRK